MNTRPLKEVYIPGVRRSVWDVMDDLLFPSDKEQQQHGRRGNFLGWISNMSISVNTQQHLLSHQQDIDTCRINLIKEW